MALEVIYCGYAKNGTGEEYLREKLIRMYKNEEGILYVQPKLRNKIFDFILVDPRRGLAILEVKDWTLDYIAEVNPMFIKTISGKEITNPTFQCRSYHNLLTTLLELSPVLVDNNTGRLKLNINTKVCMTNMSEEELGECLSFTATYPVEYFSKEKLRKLEIEDIFGNRISELGSTEINCIRGILCPEIKILDVPKGNIRRNEKIEDLIKVLDYEQERFAKRVINGHYIVTGVPGSGKTVMLLARALFLAKEYPNWKIRILSYNKSLAKKMQNKLNLMKDDLEFEGIKKENITVSTFHQLAMNLGKLESDGTQEFWDEKLPQAALEKAKPIFDSLLIDEYQDFNDTWIKLCLAVCKKYDGKENIFLAGDRLQAIYKKKDITWKSLGINIQGRSKLLKLSYRTGKKHIQTALTFLQNDEKLSEEVTNFYEGTADIEAREYGEDINFLVGNFGVVIEKIEELLINGYDFSDILILVPKEEIGRILMKNLRDEIRRNTLNSKEIVEGKMVITTYHSAKGLESKVCFLLDFDRVVDRKLAYVGMTRAAEHLYIQANDYDSENFATEVRNIVENGNI